MQKPADLHPYMTPIWNGITLESMIKFFIIYFFVVWIALIIWVAKDISSRSNSRIIQVFCVLIMILFTPLWVFLYLLIRPRKSIDDKRSSEIEGNLEILSEIVQERLENSQQVGDYICSNCDYSIESDFIICPNCKISLKDTCHECHKVIREGWKVCPYCQTKQKKKKQKKHEEKQKKNTKNKKTD